MLQITWYKKLRQLNKSLRVCQFESSTHLPGIYYIDERDGIVDVCATDVGYVPALPEFNAAGQMIKSGYRRVVSVLLHMKLTTREKVRQVFPGFFENHYPRLSSVQAVSLHQRWSEMMQEERRRLRILGDARQVDVGSPIIDKMKQMEIENFNRRNSAALSGDQFLELKEDIRADMPDGQKDELDKAKFQYDKAVGKRKLLI